MCSVQETDLHTLAMFGATLVDVFPSSIAAHKRYGLDIWMVAYPVHCVVCAMHNIEHAPESRENSLSVPTQIFPHI